MSTRPASRSRLTSAQWLRGFTLPELLLVTAILVVLGSAAVPQLRATQLNRLDLAAESVAGALRFARDESIRTGLSHSVFVNTTTHQVQVVLLPDFAAMPIPLPTLRHPLSRQPYLIDTDDDSALAPVQVGASVLDFSTLSNRDRVDFSARGEPLHNAFDSQRYRLDDGRITLQLNGALRTVSIAPLTGAISIQGGS